MDDEERHPLLDEIKRGLNESDDEAPGGQADAILNNNSNDKQIGDLDEKQSPNIQDNKEIAIILAELKQKMAEIDKITQELEEKRKELVKDSPQKTRRILEEIKVPSLDMLK